MSVLDCFSLTQHVTFPTHAKGHILDLICTSGLSNMLVSGTDFAFSDHKLLNFSFTFPTTTLPMKKMLTYRKISSVVPSVISDSIRSSTLSDCFLSNCPSEICSIYNNSISQIFDKHAPVKTRLVPSTHVSPWFTPELRAMKAMGRRLERLYRKTGLIVHSLALKEHLLKYRTALNAARSSYFSFTIKNSMCRPKTLFAMVNRLTNSPQHVISGSETIANNFSHFFSDKVKSITDSISKDTSYTTDSNARLMSIDAVPSTNSLTSFTLTTSAAISDLIVKSNSTSCQLDPIPTVLLKKCVPEIEPFITHIINCSLISAIVPAELKMAAVTPILKKPGLDHLNMNNYRPISNLPFLSKILEKVVASQLRSYLSENGLFEPFQSGFRTSHSTETALLRVTNDILRSMDSGLVNILILLDLSSAFDTVCHEILITRLSNIGITGSALSWLISYISDRKYYITIQGHKSGIAPVSQGVPQGSVLGPLLFIIYISPLGDIIRMHGLQFHCYADDIQIYLTTSSDRLSLPDSLTACIRDIKHWMSLNFLKINNNKTEILVMGTTTSVKKMDLSIDIDGVHVKPSSTVRNLGVLFDSTLSFASHISSVVKNSFFHLRNIARLRPSLTLGDAEILTHALITSRLDYCNALFLGLPKKLIARLQYVQNSAARVLTSTRRSAHITPRLHDLHWLPVASRIHFKILLLTFKALHGLAPSYLSDLLCPYSPARPLRSSELGLLSIPRFRLTTVGGRSFSVNAPKLWNSLPLSIRTITTLSTFKAQLKTYLFSSYYG